MFKSKSICILLAIVAFSQCVRAQPSAEVLWNRFQAGSADGLQLAISRTTHSVYTIGSEWNCLALLPGHSSIENGFDASRGGLSVSVLTSHDSEIIVGGSSVISWNPVKNEFTSFWPLNSRDLDVTSDGNLIAAVTEDNVLHLYDRIAAKEVMSWPNASGAIGFSPDGKLLLVGVDRTLVLIEVATRQIIHRYSSVFNVVSSLAWSPTSPGVFVESSTGVVEMDTSGQAIATWKITPGIGRNLLVYSPNGSVIASVGPGEVDLLNPISQSLSSIDAPLGAWYLGFLSDDTLVVTSFADVSLYSISKKSYIGSLNGHTWRINAMAYSGDGQWLVSGSKDHSVMVWEAASGIRKRVLRTPSEVACIGVSRDASIIVGGENDSLLLWTGKSDLPEVLLGHVGEISSIAFSPDDTSFVSTSFTGETFEWSLKTRQILNRYTSTTGGNVICYSHSDSLLAGSDKNSFAIWDRTTQQKITQFSPSGLVLSASFAADDQHLILGCYGPNQFEIHPISSDPPIVVPYVRAAYLDGMTNFPDGGHVVAIRDDSGLIVYDLNTGQIRSTAQQSGKKVYAVAVNPITGDFGSGFDDGTIVVWKAPGGTTTVRPISISPPATFDAFPTHNRIFIRSTAPQGNSRVMVYSIGGRYVWSSAIHGELSLETGPLSSGVYFVVLINERGERSFRKVSVIE